MGGERSSPVRKKGKTMKTQKKHFILLILTTLFFYQLYPESANSLNNANKLYFGTGYEFSYWDLGGDWSTRNHDYNIKFDFMINPNFFFYGNSIFYQEYIEDTNINESEYNVFPVFELGLIAYSEENLMLSLFYKKLIDDEEEEYFNRYETFSNQVGLLAEYIYNTEENGVRLSTNYNVLTGSSIYSNFLQNNFNITIKYRFSDRDQSVRQLQHRNNKAKKHAPESRIYFEIGPEFTYVNIRDNYKYTTESGIIIEQYINKSSRKFFDFKFNIDFMLNRYLFLFSDVNLYGLRIYKDGYNQIWHDRATTLHSPIYYSLGLVGYTSKSFKFTASYDSERINYNYYSDNMLDSHLRNSLNFSVHGLHFINGLDMSLFYSYVIEKSIYFSAHDIKPPAEQNIGMRFNLLFGDRDRNIRAKQHRLY